MGNKAILVQGGDGTAIPSNMVGAVITTTSAIVTTAAGPTGTEVDVTNASITLPAGVWEIKYSVTAGYTTGETSGNNGNVVVCITDSSNTHIGKSERLIYVKAVSAVANTIFGCLSASAIVNISSTTTYKLRLKRNDNLGAGSGSVEVATGGNDATFFATRIA